MQIIWRVCKECGGSGFVKGWFYNGLYQGIVTKGRYSYYPADSEFKEVECTACKGSGKVQWGYIEDVKEVG